MMKIMQVSLTGTSHLMFQVPNQDAVAVYSDSETAVAAVCDGVSLNTAGTWSCSEIAAGYCAESFVGCTAGRQPSTDVVFRGFQHTATGLLQELKQRNIPWMDCQCTMLGVLVTPDMLIAGMAGDGGIICEDAEGELQVLVTRPKTDSMVDPVILASAWRFARVPEPRKVLVMIDGLFDQLVALEEGELRADLNQVRKWLDADQEQLEKLAATAPGHDDKTAVLIRFAKDEVQDLPDSGDESAA